MILVYYEVTSRVTGNKYNRHTLVHNMREFYRKMRRQTLWVQDHIVVESVVPR